MADPEIVVRGRSDFRKLESDLARSQARVSSWGRNAKRAAAGGLLVAAAAAVKFGIDSVRSASNAQQSIGATQTVFEKYAGTVIKQSNRAANAIGLSANEYRELSNATGAMLASSGMDLEKVTDLTTKLNKRGADVAATFGGTTREAVEAFGSALRGETDPIERYGVSIKATDVSARLAAKGQDKLTGSALKQAEQMARLDLIFEQTAKSQGQFARESDTHAGAQQRLAAKVENLQAKVGKLLLPVLTELTNFASNSLVPALANAAEWVEQNEDEIGRFAGTVKDTVLPPLEALFDLVGRAAGVLADLPGPVQTFAAQAALAALVVPRLTGAIGAGSTVMGGYVTKLKDAEQRTKLLGTAARSAAGIGGILALSAAAQTSNQSLGFLGKTASGALLGFSVGGPWGAAIGTGAGALYGLASATSESAVEMVTAKDNTKAYIDTLNQLTGAASAATRQRVKDRLLADENSAGLIREAASYGVSTRDIISATMGQEGALRRLQGAQQAALAEYQRLKGLHGFGAPQAEEARLLEGVLFQLLPRLRDEGDILERNARRARQNALETERLSTVYKGIPQRVLTEIRTLGGDVTLREAKSLIRQYELTPKQVQTIFRANNIEMTDSQVRRLVTSLKDTEDAGRRANRNLGEVGNAKPSSKWIELFRGDIRRGEDQSQEGAAAMRRFLKAAGEQAPNGQPFLTGLSGIISRGRSSASSGGREIGAAMKTGLEGGFSGAITNLSNMARSAVAGAIAAGHAAAESNSPSRKTMRLGKDLGDGLVIGLDRTRPAASKAGRDLVESILGGLTSGSDGVEKALSRIQTLIERTVKLKDSKAEAAREREILKSLKDRYGAIREAGKAQDRLNERIDRERETLRGLINERREYAQTVADGIRNYSALTGLLSTEEGALNDAPALLERLRQRLANTQVFSGLLTSLRKGGLTESLVQQIEKAGVEGGLAIAEAISAGGPAAIREFSTIQAQIDAISTKIGTDSAASLYDAGIASAQGLVKGLEAQSANVEKWARKLARTLVRALKDELGIRSPSKVTELIGVDMMRGLELGLADTRAKSLGSVTAEALVKGFGTPSLSARAMVLPAVNGGRGAGGNTYRITVVAPVGSSKAEIGGEVVSLIKAYEKAGGRELATG